MVDVGAGELQAPGRGRGADVLGPDDVADDLERGPRVAGERAADAVEVAVELDPVGGDLRRHVAKRAPVTGEAERRSRGASTVSRPPTNSATGSGVWP